MWQLLLKMFLLQVGTSLKNIFNTHGPCFTVALIWRVGYNIQGSTIEITVYNFFIFSSHLGAVFVRIGAYHVQYQRILFLSHPHT